MKFTLFFMMLFIFILIGTAAEMFKGIRMCQRDCRVTKRCKGVYYNSVHLECLLLFDLTGTGQPTPPDVVLRVMKNTTTRDLMKTCSANERLIVNKLDKHVCVHIKDTAETESGQLFLVSTKVYQLDLKSHVVTQVPFPCKSIACVAYLKVLRRFLLCCTNEVSASTIPHYKRMLVRRRINALDIAADEEEDIVFVKILERANEDIYRMTQTGAQFKKIFRKGRGSNIFTIDTKHKLMYVCEWMQLASFTYDGTPTADFVHKLTAKSVIVYNPELDGIYYIGYRQLMMVTKRGEHRKLAVFKWDGVFKPSSARLLGKYLYISLRYTINSIIVVDVSEPKKSKTLKFEISENDLVFPHEWRLF